MGSDRGCVCLGAVDLAISIHAPRVGSDILKSRRAFNVEIKISIHAPRVGSDAETLDLSDKTDSFQSTLPVWGATRSKSWAFVHLAISIHAPRVGSDERTAISRYRKINFNPRSPCGERQKGRGDP